MQATCPWMTSEFITLLHTTVLMQMMSGTQTPSLLLLCLPFGAAFLYMHYPVELLSTRRKGKGRECKRVLRRYPV